MENFNKNHLNRLINLCSEKDSEELAVIGGRAKEFISQNLHHLSDEEHADHAAAWREMSGGAPYPVDLNYYGGDERTILTAMGVAFLLWLAWRYAYTRSGSPELQPPRPADVVQPPPQPPAGPPESQRRPPAGPPESQPQPPAGSPESQPQPPAGSPESQRRPPAGPPESQQRPPAGPPESQQRREDPPPLAADQQHPAGSPQPPAGSPESQPQPPAGPPESQPQPPAGPPESQQRPADQQHPAGSPQPPVAEQQRRAAAVAQPPPPPPAGSPQLQHKNEIDRYRYFYSTGLINNKIPPLHNDDGSVEYMMSPVLYELRLLGQNPDLIIIQHDDQNLLTYSLRLDKLLKLLERGFRSGFHFDNRDTKTTSFYYPSKKNLIRDVIFIMKPFFHKKYEYEMLNDNNLYSCKIKGVQISINEVLCIIMPGGLEEFIYNKVYDKFKVNIYHNLQIDRYIKSVHDVEKDDIYTKYNVKSIKTPQGKKNPYTKINLTKVASDYIMDLYKLALLNHGLIKVDPVPKFEIDNYKDIVDGIFTMHKYNKEQPHDDILIFSNNVVTPLENQRNMWSVVLDLNTCQHLTYLLLILLSIVYEKENTKIIISKFTSICVCFYTQGFLYEIKCKIDFILKYADNSIFKTKNTYAYYARYGNYVQYSHGGIQKLILDGFKVKDTSIYALKGQRDPFTNKDIASPIEANN